MSVRLVSFLHLIQTRYRIPAGLCRKVWRQQDEAICHTTKTVIFDIHVWQLHYFTLVPMTSIPLIIGSGATLNHVLIRMNLRVLKKSWHLLRLKLSQSHAKLLHHLYVTWKMCNIVPERRWWPFPTTLKTLQRKCGDFAVRKTMSNDHRNTIYYSTYSSQKSVQYEIRCNHFYGGHRVGEVECIGDLCDTPTIYNDSLNKNEVHTLEVNRSKRAVF